uniref:ATPase family protein n=1 Tax=Marseillevirus LCMAC101 TaxID=2506602 RepID=A0A481YR50_9VIRU|nr:MAG: ATPase family protein [Marseillevirus LCMAC101]
MISSLYKYDEDEDEKFITYDKELCVWVADGFAYTADEVAFGRVKSNKILPLTDKEKKGLEKDSICVWEKCNTQKMVDKMCEKVYRKYIKEVEDESDSDSDSPLTSDISVESSDSEDSEESSEKEEPKSSKKNKYKKYNTLVIGLDSESSIGVVKSTTLYTGTKNGYTLDWFDLTQTKHVPEETFSTIIVHDYRLLSNSRVLHNVLRTLTYEGMLCCNQKMSNISSNGLTHTGRSAFQVGKKMVYYERYERGDSIEKEWSNTEKEKEPGTVGGEEKKKKRKAQIYKTVSIKVGMCYEAVEPKMGITIEQFREELDKPDFIERYRKAQEKFMAYKKKFYNKKLVEFQKEARNTSKFSDMMSSSEGKHVGDIKEILKTITDHVTDITDEKTRSNLIDALENEEKGLAAITGRDDIKQEIITMLYSFGNQYTVMTNAFHNIAFLGPAGVGKTFSANVLAYVFCKAGILATETFCPVTRTDLVAGYVGQTAPMTRKKLIETLEGVLFIDECYQLCQVDGGSRDFGNESLAEIVNFIDKYIGMSVIIVAGYEKPMMEKFFPSNEGMLRRFPYRFVLAPYTNSQLSDILLNFVEEKTETKIDRKTGNIIFTMISDIQKQYPEAFNNQAGDMLNLGGEIAKAMLSLYNRNWRDCKKEVILDAFNRYLAPKKMGITLDEDEE